MKISIVCAFNPNRNTGMYTVDKAALDFFKNLPDAKLSFYTIGDLSQFDSGESEETINYMSLLDNYESFISSDRIVYWGDFLHSYTYWINDLIPRMLAHKVSSSFDESIEHIYKTILLEGAETSVLNKVVIYGSTMLPDDSTVLTEDRYFSGIKRLLSHSRGVFFRDALSNAKYSFLDSDRSMYGTDCAILNSNTYPISTKINNKVAVYFGRSGRLERLKFLTFAYFVTKKSGKKPKWVQWFPQKNRDRIFSYLLSGKVSQEQQQPSDIIQNLYSYDFVITDVYHMAVNSWARGIPAILIGYGAKHDKGTLGSKKKETLYAQFFLQKFYVYWEDLSLFNFHKTIKDVCSTLENKSTIKKLNDIIRAVALKSSLRLKQCFLED
ncbi:hypothetical protein [Amphritea sp. HPY]|uniref:hypothetical protein n=1 Tax=Amphritea sp. HPY TaxID=3421652 RepID=UPI003D7CCF8E